MLTINIQNDKSSIQTIDQSLKTNQLIEIILPKQFSPEEIELLPLDYYRAGYAGQLLKSIAIDFLFSIPEPASNDHFSFILVTEQPQKLAAILKQLSDAYNDDTEIILARFDQQALSFLTKIADDEEIACPPYYIIIDDLVNNG